MYNMYNGVRAVNGKLYLIGNDLRILDVSDPAQPKLLGTLSKYFYANDTAIADDRLYTVAQDYLEIVDVRIPSNPVPLPRTSLPKAGFGIAVQNGRAYVACLDAGLLVYDVSGGLPRVIQTIPVTNALDVAVRADRLYVAATTWGSDTQITGTLEVYDIESSGTLNFNQRLIKPRRGYHELALVGNHLVAVSYDRADPTVDRVELFDLSDPEHMALVAETSLVTGIEGYGFGHPELAASGDFLFFPTWVHGTYVMQYPFPKNSVDSWTLY